MPVTRTAAARAGAPAPRRSARAGFSIVEALVAATLGLLIMSAVVTLFVGQLRAYSRVRGMAAVQRDLRLGLALLPMDLRGASRADSDFVHLSPTAVELRATIGTSVICNATSVTAGTTTLTTLVLPPLEPPTNTTPFTAFFTLPQNGDPVKVLIRTEAGGVGDRWLTATAAAPLTSPALTAVPANTAARLCTGASTNPATPRRNRQAMSLVWSTTPAPTAADLARVTPGMPVRVLRRVRYELRAAASGRFYLMYRERRPDGTLSDPEPIAGPFDSDQAAAGRSGVRFAYFDTLGAPMSAPLDAPAGLTAVGRIDVTLRPRTQVRAGTTRDSVVVRDSALVRVALRNRF